ncbi:hemerythrin family protein [Terasakiella sp. A23]|uniref:bacteriohemerythrin n=1 Tax=Terasakiella sp. FCG-A23 TaxID=3080561 RepID=UPI002952D78F|nr:hemerythrin family protein [Terasakiella sp. A23]MDV7339980.1 hemerythrin family protein [Terasakiella sp. A23]
MLKTVRDLCWDDKVHSVGHPILDEQHKILFNLINSLSHQASYQHATDDLKGYNYILAELKKYIEFHLTYEEDLLTKMSYEDVQIHKANHKKFVDEIGAITIQDDDRQNKVRLVEFLRKWWEGHVLVEDMKYKETMITVVN